MRYKTILTYKHPALKTVSTPITFSTSATFYESLVAIKEEMIATIKEYNAAGIAAIQIGYPLRIIVVKNDFEFITLCNPTIELEVGETIAEEGCLSIPGVFGEVKRARTITVSYKDLECNSSIIKASGKLARVLQHEIDHLDGILFVEKAENLRYDSPGRQEA